MPCIKSAESPQVAARVNASKPKSTARTPVNNLRLSDIAKLIEGRHGFLCTDREWARRYFFAALPHLIVSRTRWLDAVRDWVCAYTAILLVGHGGEWIDEQARQCHAKPRKTPRQGKLCRLLAVQADEIDAYGLVTLTAAGESAKARGEKDRERRRQAEQRRRESQPGHTPRAMSKAAKARANDTTAAAIRSKAWRENKAKHDLNRANAQQNVTTTERVSCPTDSGIQTADAQCFVTTPNAFRAPQYRLDCERVSCPTTNNQPILNEQPYKPRANRKDVNADRDF